jgi:hypothetical protein
MSNDTEIRDRQVRWLDLVVPRRSLERRVRRNAHLDALRGVRGMAPDVQTPAPASGEARRADEKPRGADGEPRHAGPPPAAWQVAGYPASVVEIAAWEASTLRALGSHVHRLAGQHEARIESLRARIVALGPPPEERLAAAGHVPRTEAVAAPVTASHPAAQARRWARQDAHLWAAADSERTALQAELAEEVALRAAAVEAAREATRQCHESSRALQHLYWAVRTRWSRRRHGPPPAVTFADVPLPEWVMAPELLYGGRRHD